MPGPLPKLYFLCEGSTEPGDEILLLTPEGNAGSWGACKCSSLYFLMGGGLCTLCVIHTGQEPGICCCFYGTTDSLCAPPTASVWLADCVCMCVCEHYESWGWGGGGWGCSPLPLRLALFRHFQLEGVVSVETDLNFKPI